MSNKMSNDAFWRSWDCCDGVESFDDLYEWIEKSNKSTEAIINTIPLAECVPWFYDERSGRIRNPKGSFFEVAGLRMCGSEKEINKTDILEQPIFIQNEIGYLGILCKNFDGIMHFLMQAKIEPGNINKIQLSPTIQATKSNFTQKHGGKKPAYLDYFIHSDRHTIIVDQIQSEQSSRFLGKRNRNVIVEVCKEPEILSSHRWMTLGQIQRFMRYDNLVNMDSRTVLSCIPWSAWTCDEKLIPYELDGALVKSMHAKPSIASLNNIYRVINNYKMFSNCATELIPLKDMRKWNFSEKGITHKDHYPFQVIYCDIAIEGREVRRWKQPLFKAEGKALFGLFVRECNGVYQFLVNATPEIGCFDMLELGPTVQIESFHENKTLNCIESKFVESLTEKKGVMRDVSLSEEGGRFYHEENRNAIIKIDKDLNKTLSTMLSEGYCWLDFSTLNMMLRINNVLNIQLRNLLSLLSPCREHS